MIHNYRSFSFIWRIVAAVMIVGGLTMLVAGCTTKEPIRVGFVADLTGRHAELGVQIRNGVMLAVEKINAAGGISGRQIELIIRDDLGDPETAKKVDCELISEGVVAIIGHGTTAQTLAGLEVTNPAQILLLGPTISSPALSGKDDYFYRVYPSFANGAQALAVHIYQKRNIHKLAIWSDTDNNVYSSTYRGLFTRKFSSLGGILTGDIGFSSSKKNDLDLLIKKIKTGNPDGVLLITTDVDTALIAQRMRLLGCQVPLFATAWAQTDNLIYNGGKAVEGMEFEHVYAYNSCEPEFIDFNKRYQSNYGQKPSFGAAFGYETAMVLATALQKSGGKTEGLRQALLEIRTFKVLFDAFSFDPNGDVNRPAYLSVVRNGEFVIIDSLNLKNP